MRRVCYDVAPLIFAQFDSGLAERAKYWAISDLYSALSGKEYTKMLLAQVYRYEIERAGEMADEEKWHEFALNLGMKFTKEEILKWALETPH